MLIFSATRMQWVVLIGEQCIPHCFPVGARATLASIARSSNVVWDVDDTHLSGGSRHCVSLRSLYFVLLSMVERFIEMWSEVRVRIYFQGADCERESTEAQYRTACNPHISDTAESAWIKGRLMMQFGYVKKKTVSEECSASRGLVSLHALNQVLSDAGGGSSVRNWAQGVSLGSGSRDSYGLHNRRKYNGEILQMSDCRGDSEGLICWIPCGVLQRNRREEHSVASQQSFVGRRIDQLMNLFVDSSERRRNDEIFESVAMNMHDRRIQMVEAIRMKSERTNNINKNNSTCYSSSTYSERFQPQHPR